MERPSEDDDSERRGPGRPPVVAADDIVVAATAMIERDGLEGFSMRRLATELEVWPTTVYNHVGNKDAVLDAVADRFLGSIPLPPVVGAWDEWLEDFATAVRATWVAHPRLLAVVMTRPGRGAAIAVMLDRFLGVLRDAGFAPGTAHSAWHAIQNHLFGEVYQVARWGPGPRDPAAPEWRDPGAYPTLAAWGGELAACDRDEQFRIGLRLIITGLQSRVAAG